MARQRVFSGAGAEALVGYCRALKTGDRIFVSGTASLKEDGAVHAPGDAYAQTRYCLERIEQALAEFGAALSDIVRIRMFVTDISRWSEFGKAHREIFADHPPAACMVEIGSLGIPELLIEIEADAVVDS